MKKEELIIKPHYFVALLIYFLKSLAFIFILIFSFKLINYSLGYDLIAFIVDTLSISIENIINTDSPLFKSIILGYFEDTIFDVLLATLILTFVQQSNTLNKGWIFTNKELEFREGVFGMKKTIVPLDKIIRVYGVPKADFRHIGHMFIELSIREKKLKLPYVFQIDKLTKEISTLVDRYKEEIIEKDIEEDIEKDIEKNIINKTISKDKIKKEKD